MWRVHFGSLIGPAFMVGMLLIGCHSKEVVHKSSFVLSSTTDNAQEFRSLFAAEPTCHGLTLGQPAAIRLHYYGAVDAGRTQFGGYIVFPNTKPDLTFSGETAQQAISNACAILKQQGGTVQ